MRSLLALVLLLSFATPAGACLWTYETDLRGDIHLINDFGADRYVESLQAKRPRADWEREAQKSWSGDFKSQNDRAVVLLHLGKIEQAIEILEKIEEVHPGRYETASNLGTAYELAGEIERAQHWIKEGLSRNPQSHYGSEWIHLEVLKVKSQLASDPDWLISHPVLPPLQSPSKAKREARAEALRYQVHERLTLLEPPDVVLAELLAELAYLEGELGSAERSAAVYQLALDYGPAQPDTVAQSLEKARAAVASRRWLVSFLNRYGHPALLSLYGGLAGVLALFAGLWHWRRKRRARTSRAHEN